MFLRQTCARAANSMDANSAALPRNWRIDFLPFTMDLEGPPYALAHFGAFYSARTWIWIGPSERPWTNWST